MSILTKEERADLMARANQTIMDSPRHPEQFKTWACEISNALDTIDAMERTIKSIERATTMQQVETVLIAARAFGVIEEDTE